MRTKYQRAFDHVAASHRLKEEVRNMTKQERRALHRQVPKTLLAAVLVVLLLAGTALAVSTPGIQDWFRQYWQEATGQTKMDKGQAAAVDGLTQSVGSQAAGQERAPRGGRGGDGPRSGAGERNVISGIPGGECRRPGGYGTIPGRRSGGRGVGGHGDGGFRHCRKVKSVDPAPCERRLPAGKALLLLVRMAGGRA